MGTMATIAQAARETMDFLLPRECASCGVDGEALCNDCADALVNKALVVQLAFQRHLYECPIIAATDYGSRAKAVISAFKDKGMHSLATPLSTVMAGAWSTHGALWRTPVLLVPVPSAPGGRIRRGYEPTWLLASQLATRIPAARAIRALQRRHTLFGRQRKTMSRRERLVTTPRYRSRFDLRGYAVVIVDDVVTTGVSLEAAALALTHSGARVVGAIVAASATREGSASREAGNSGDSTLATGLRWRPSQADS
jgi:predicted amidophosphoribosyltransferase